MLREDTAPAGVKVNEELPEKTICPVGRIALLFKSADVPEKTRVPEGRSTLVFKEFNAPEKVIPPVGLIIY